MPPRLNSRYQYSRAFRDEEDLWYLEIPEYGRFMDEVDNLPYVVKTGDNLQVLAYRFFPGMENPAQYWWVIAMFNDIVDADEELEENRLLIIPSERLLREVLLTPPENFRSIVSDLGVNS